NAVSGAWSGMKYTGKYFLLAGMVLAMAGSPLRAQVTFLTPGNNLVSSPAPSTSSSSDSDDTVVTIKKRVDEVNVLFIATDKRGKFVRNLDQKDFAILDDHKPPQSIVNFRRETDLPIQLGLLIDTSGSVRGRFDFEQDAAVSFLQNTVRPNFDKAFVVAFNGHSQMMQDFTDNATLLSTAVHNMHDGGGTALYDAIYRACHENLIKDHEDRPSRRAIVVVSDG